MREYLVDLNATQAAIRAGYSKKTAGAAAARLLQNVSVHGKIRELIEKRAQKADISAERVLRELARIGFSDIRKVVKWGSTLDLADPETGEREVVHGIALVDSGEIDDDTALAISEVSRSDRGTIKVKLYDKRAALVDLGRHIGLFPTGKKDEDKSGSRPAAAIVVPAKVKADPNERPAEAPTGEPGVVLPMKRQA